MACVRHLAAWQVEHGYRRRYRRRCCCCEARATGNVASEPDELRALHLLLKCRRTSLAVPS